MCDNSPAYASQKFSNFPESWKISNTTGIAFNPQGQAIVEKTDRAIVELLVKTITPEARRDPHLALTEVLFPMNFLSFNDKGLSLAYKPSVNEYTPASGKMERFISLQCLLPAPLITCKRGYAYAFPQIAMMPIWVPIRDVCLIIDQPASIKERITQDG